VCRDFPNAWAPLVDMVVEGLDATGLPRGRMMAREISRDWLRSNFVAYQQIGKMIEKYDATSCGKIGGGGEYNPQVHTILHSTEILFFPFERTIAQCFLFFAGVHSKLFTCSFEKRVTWLIL
jgi:neutral trehalase